MMKYLYLLALVIFPMTAHAQIFETYSDPSAETSSTGQALEFLCKVQAEVYQTAASYSANIAEIDRNRERQERVTIEIEQLKKVDPEAAKTRIKSNGEAYYDSLIREPSACAKIDQQLTTLISQNEAQIKKSVETLVLNTKNLDEADRADFAAKFADCSAKFKTQQAQQVIYACVYRQKNTRNVPLSYSVEKTLRKLYTLQEPLLNAWLGNVD